VGRGISVIKDNIIRLNKLIFYGEWSFFADGVYHTRRNLSVKARFNLLLQLLTKKFRLPISLGIPYCLTVEPASICNLRCSTCPAGLKRVMCKPVLLGFEDFKRTIDLFGEYITYIQLWSWGEPFLNPALTEMIAYAKKRDIVMVSSTNGHFLDDETMVVKLVHSGLDELILAVDGTTQEVYEQYREGGDLQRVLAGIKELVRIRAKEGSTLPRLHLRMVINPYNEHQKDDFAALASSLGVDLVSFKKIDTGWAG
jgi:MoaA/NifB/PqqE/SkfB family radical SAM enzyme